VLFLPHSEEIREELVSLKVGNTLANLNNTFAENEVSYHCVAFYNIFM